MEDAPSAFEIWLQVSVILIIALILLYRRGYFINISGNINTLINNVTNTTKPEVQTITRVRRLSYLEKIQIEEITIKSEFSLSKYSDGTNYRYWAVLKIKNGKEKRFILSDDYKIPDSDQTKLLFSEKVSLNKEKILLRRLEHQQGETYWEIYPL